MRSILLVITLVIGCSLFLFAGFLFAGKKKKEDFTQTLALPKDPPLVAVGETSRLTFQVSPLSAKGLLSAQTRDAVRALLKMNGGSPIVHVRAFVAGSGDLRRVPQIVSEVLSEKKMELPSVSVVQGGALSLLNAQVVLESISSGKKDVNRGGLRFVQGQVFTAPDPSGKVEPLLRQSMDALLSGVQNGEALRVTCFVSNLETGAIAEIEKKFPSAQVDLVQTQRAPARALASCEAVARGGPVTAGRLAFTGTQIAFGYDEKDAALAFQRFDQQLTQAGSNAAEVVSTNFYPLTLGVVTTARKIRPVLQDAPVPFEGLASMDASFAIDAVAVAR